MKKIIIVISCFVLLLTGCAPKYDPENTIGTGTNKKVGNPKMVGVVKQISYKNEKISSILILGDKNAEYVFTINEKSDFKDAQNLSTGDKVEIEHSGELLESYPAQGTALKIIILESNKAVAIDSKLYTVLPITGQYNEALFQKTMNTLGVFNDILDDKAEFDKYMKEINFGSENKINLAAKYDENFFKNHKLIFIAKSTSSTPTHSISTLTKGNGMLNILMEEKTSEIQTMDITMKGFLIEVESSVIQNNTAVNIQYIYKVVTK